VLFVVTGPSGCGKSTMIHHVMRDLRNVRFSVSHTTRPPRPSESEGRDYHFVSRAVFERMIGRRQFAEWAVVHGHLYGTSKREISAKNRSADVILDIDVQGARQIMALGIPEVSVFVLPPRYQDLVRRLRDRGEDKADVIERRLRNARAEVRQAPKFEYLIVNDKLDRAVLELESIILASRCRLDSRRAAIRRAMASFK
jgi:guanylate kinase